jgi:hypothetical protein
LVAPAGEEADKVETACVRKSVQLLSVSAPSGNRPALVLVAAGVTTVDHDKKTGQENRKKTARKPGKPGQEAVKETNFSGVECLPGLVGTNSFRGNVRPAYQDTRALISHERQIERLTLIGDRREVP